VRSEEPVNCLLLCAGVANGTRLIGRLMPIQMVTVTRGRDCSGCAERGDRLSHFFCGRTLIAQRTLFQ